MFVDVNVTFDDKLLMKIHKNKYHYKTANFFKIFHWRSIKETWPILQKVYP